VLKSGPMINKNRLPKLSRVACAAFFFAAPSLWAIDLPEVLVTAPPITPGTIVLDQRDMQEAPGVGLAEWLDWSGEVDVNRKGDAQADLSLQASTFEQTGISFDGFPIRDPQTGHFNLDLLLPSGYLGAVEISPVPWGSRGLSGSVNLVPKAPSGKGASLSSSIGSFNTTRSKASLQWSPVGLWGGYAKSDGYREDADSLLRNAGFMASLKDLLKSKAFFSYSNQRFGANDFYGRYPKYAEWEATETYLATWRGDAEGSWGRFEPGLIWRKHTDHFVLDRYHRSAYENFHTTQTGGLDTRWTYKPFRGDLFAKGEWMKSRSLGNRRRGSAGLSGLWESAFGSLGVEGVALGKGHFEVCPLLTTELKSGESFRFSAAATRAYREASFTELYYVDPQNKGDAMVRPESAWNFRVSPQWTQGRFSAQADGFVRAERQLIDWARPVGTTVWRSLNIGHATATGSGVRFGWNATKVRLQVGYDYLFRKADINGWQSKYALNFPRHKVTVRCSGDIQKLQWSLGWSRCLRTDRQLYTLLEGKLSFRTHHGSVYVSALNALDADYQEVGGVPMPGRSFEGGLSVAF
jgi:vitamin B12 transporter